MEYYSCKHAETGQARWDKGTYVVCVHVHVHVHMLRNSRLTSRFFSLQGFNHESQLGYLFPQEEEGTARPLAPFGNDFTPQMRVRLVGGIPQMIVEDNKFKSVEPAEM